MGGLTLLVTVAYWGIWARYTLRFDRRRDVIPQTVFGLLWGFASGMLFLAFYQVARAIGGSWATWQVWLLAYVLITIWQYKDQGGGNPYPQHHSVPHFLCDLRERGYLCRFANLGVAGRIVGDADACAMVS
jgi:hypothetical protein